jgi:5-methylthioribose kinase
MSLRDEAMGANPDFPWLKTGHTEEIASFMRERGWLERGEGVISSEPAGNGNMNLTLRIHTTRRDLVLKQARPWVEKYDHVAAPWDRALVEIEFYRTVSALDGVREYMPKLLGSDRASRCLALEYIEGSGDFTFLYGRDSRAVLARDTIEQAANFLAALHRGTLRMPEPRLSNTEMRQLNRAHIFEIPLSRESGVDLDSLEPGLSLAADSLRGDADYREAVDQTEHRYLTKGRSLLHGDFFPGSWLQTERGLVVIDPEFCFFGAVEIDLGCAVAHFALSEQPADCASSFVDCYNVAASEIVCEEHWISRFASAEVMRRLIGVAQLPIPATGTGDRFRAAFLERSRQAMLEGEMGLLFD